jgi:hypothetical protein
MMTEARPNNYSNMDSVSFSYTCFRDLILLLSPSETFQVAPATGNLLSSALFFFLFLARFSLSFSVQRKSGKEKSMKKHLLAGVIIGGLMGVMTAWFAMSDALPQGGLVALAGAFDGMMAGLGIGWLIGINVMEGAADEEDEMAHLSHGGDLAKAH